MSFGLTNFTKKFPAFAVLNFSPNENLNYRRWLALLKKELCIKDCQGDSGSVTVTVPTAITEVRAANSSAGETVIYNQGWHEALVYEKGHIIGVIWPQESMVIVGRFAITAEGLGGTTELLVETRSLCDCLNGISENSEEEEDEDNQT